MPVPFLPAGSGQSSSTFGSIQWLAESAPLLSFSIHLLYRPALAEKLSKPPPETFVWGTGIGLFLDSCPPDFPLWVPQYFEIVGFSPPKGGIARVDP